MQRDSFIFYRSFYDCLDGLNNEQKVQLFDAICQFSLNFKDVEIEGVVKSLFVLIRPNLEANNKRFISGNKPKIKRKASKKKARIKQVISKPEANKDKDKDVDKDVDKEENKEYVYPPFLEFLEYAKTIEPRVDADDLHKKYQAWVNNKWHDGNGKEIKNWKSKINSTLPYIKVKAFTPPV